MRLSVVGITKLPVHTDYGEYTLRCHQTKKRILPQIFNAGLKLFEDLFECSPNCCRNEIREVITLIATMVTDL